MKSGQKGTNWKCSLATMVALAGGLLHGMAQIPMAFERFDRFNQVEFYGIGQYLHSSDINFNGPGGTVKVRMDDTVLGGMGIGYHFNEFFSVHGDFMFGGATFVSDLPTSTAGTINYKQDATLQTGRFNLDYNIINRRITPFLTTGIGYQYLETEIKNAPPINGCWWDPWYGWVCYSGQPHAWQTDFTWNAGAGFRWNITDRWFIKATGGATWLDYGGAHGITTQIEGIFAIGASW
jgi:opacity protein-like surface antigen